MPKTKTQVERAIRVLEIAAQEGVLFGKYGPAAAALAGGIRGYMAARNSRQARALAARIALATTPKPRKSSPRYRDSLSGLLVKEKVAKKRPARHTRDMM